MKPDDDTIKHLESRAKIYAEEKKKQQVDSLEKALLDAKSKLEAAQAKAAKKNPKDTKGKDDKKDEKAEQSPEELAVQEAEGEVSTAEKAKARVEESAPEVLEAPLLDKVFEDLVAVEDVSSGRSWACLSLSKIHLCLKGFCFEKEFWIPLVKRLYMKSLYWQML